MSYLEYYLHNRKQEKSIVKQLTNHYINNLTETENAGHVVGYYADDNKEIVKDKYEFLSGTFTVHHKHEINGRFFYQWAYDPIK
jgi:hypothetical protein